jgi:hypothetical protein
MGRLATGQFLTSRPLTAAWGAREWPKQVAPAVGTNWTFKVPPNFYYRLVTLRVVLTTSAQVGNRLLGVKLLDNNGNNYFESVAAGVQEAGTEAALTVTIAGSNTNVTKNVSQALEFPDMILPPEWEIQGSTHNIQTEDQHSAPVVYVEAFERNPDHPIAAEEHIRQTIRVLEGALNG